MSAPSIPDLGQEAVVPMDYQPPAGTLRDRVILITGAANGLGRAAAMACADAGARVILLDKALKQLERLYDELTAAGAPEPLIHPMNLEGVGPAEFLELATAVDQQFGRLDGLLHSASMLGELSPMQQYDPELWARTLHVNINAPFLLNQVCIPLLKRSKDARIVFTSDRTGRLGRAFWGAYGVANGALETMMEILALELGANSTVRINSFDPGAVNTGLRRQAYPAEDTAALSQPDDLAACYVYMLGPDSRALHGRRLGVASIT
ncbi:MAG: YciK family oxidoreductase [Aquisalimonadaceae bacterium]